ncbi:MAG: acetoacetyl-CoA synthetase [Planctomycetota bacterium]|nr:MAG: acetoacetyl-CoA synthetase [Planctomycetota bacterium]
MKLGELLWAPSPSRVEASQMHGFLRAMSAKHGFAADWASLHRWSVERREVFWREMLALSGAPLPMDDGRTVVGEGMLGTRWFPGVLVNYAAHLMRHRDDRPAIVAEDERGRTRRLTHHDVRAAASRCAQHLLQFGLDEGDRVVGFVPNIPEAVIAMLAASSRGMIWSSCSPDFGIQGVLDRFGQIAPRVLFAADGYTYNGKPIDCLGRLRAIVEKIPSIEKVIVIPFLNEHPDLSGLRNAETWASFVDDYPQPEEVAYRSVPFDHPLFIMYSSGTTGIPKCIVHGHGGTMLQHAKEHMLHCDLRRDDVMMYFTTCGWMMWNWLVSALGVGSTIVLYEGSPTHPGIRHLWELAERTGITVFGTSPKFIAACENAGIRPGREHDLSKLRCLLSTGSPLTVENFAWVYENVKADLQLSSISGGTDIISCFVLGNPMLPVHAGEIQCKGLGMDVHAYDEDRRSVVGRKGELVCASPFPSQPVGFWNDPDGSKYRKAYFEDIPGVWRHGDYIEFTPRGGAIIYGRSDATLNPGGVRIGTAEIYRIVEALDEVTDSIVVGKDVDGDVDVCLFVVLRPGVTLDADLEKRIRDRIAAGATRRHVPKHIRQVPAIPYTISGKKVELAVRNVIHGLEVKNKDALSNPESLEHFRGLV